MNREVAGVPPRLWVYTNFDCNLRCSYCLSSSYPGAPRRELSLLTYKRLVDEAAAEGIREVYLTGGEPFLLPDIFARIGHAAARMPVTVLTNGSLLRGTRLRRLAALKALPLTLQVSLDGPSPDFHDPYRGRGSWHLAVTAIRTLVDEGFQVSVGATETPLNTAHLGELERFVSRLGVPQDCFLVRPLTKRGLSDQGLELTAADMVPELTVTREGVYWHPQTAGEALLLARDPFPLRAVIDLLLATYRAIRDGGSSPQHYRCA